MEEARLGSTRISGNVVFVAHLPSAQQDDPGCVTMCDVV